MRNIGKIIGELHALLIEYEKGLYKKVAKPQVLTIQGGRIHKPNKKLQAAKGKGKVKACGNVQQLTPPYTPQHNGVSERRNRTLLDMVRLMMNLITLSLSFWDYALESATCILNMVPTKKERCSSDRFCLDFTCLLDTKLSTLEALKGLILKIPGAITLSLFITVDSREEGAEFKVTGVDKAFDSPTLGKILDLGRRVTEYSFYPEEEVSDAKDQGYIIRMEYPYFYPWDLPTELATI
ncbi:retrotransposon protein, putative, ty1-copia subclass [Tanacetum coccineum]